LNLKGIKSKFLHSNELEFSSSLPSFTVEQQDAYRKMLDNAFEILDQENIQSLSDILIILNRHKNLLNDYPFAIFLACKILQPSIVVETGVAHGFSTYAILSSLKKQFLDEDTFKLFSIDYNSSENFKTGWVCETLLKNNWFLINGTTDDELKPLLNKLGEIDCFFHDSSHYADKQLEEYIIAWKHIKKNGVIISDDITKAFDIFVKKANPPPQRFFKIAHGKIGIIIK
jgi:hypothetical protein